PTSAGTSNEPRSPPTATMEITRPMVCGLNPRTLTKYRVSNAEPKANPMLVIEEDVISALINGCLSVNCHPSRKDLPKETRSWGSGWLTTMPDFFLKPHTSEAAAKRFAVAAANNVKGAETRAIRTPATPGAMIPTEVSTVSFRAYAAD